VKINYDFRRLKWWNSYSYSRGKFLSIVLAFYLPH